MNFIAIQSIKGQLMFVQNYILFYPASISLSDLHTTFLLKKKKNTPLSSVKRKNKRKEKNYRMIPNSSIFYI